MKRFLDSKKNKKVLLIGWDAADWKIISPLLEKGKMPNLQKLISSGASGTIQTLDPPLSPMLWTSIATGKTADKHGILGFIEPDSKTSEPRPASVTSRNCKAVWNILTQEGFKTNVVGWWPSHPAEPVNGIYVSNMFTKSEKEKGLILETVYPPEMIEEMENCRVYPEDISILELIPFVPQATRIDQNKDKHLHNLVALLANCNSIQNVAKHVLQNSDWNFSAVYFDTIDQTCHTFMKFYPPQMMGVPDEYFQLYNNVISQMYVHHDKMLGELIDLTGNETTIILLSDHGFFSDHLRPARLPNDPASPALEHSPFGILCMSGNEIKQKIIIKGSSLLDITPSILHLFDLAVGKDMDGTILSDIFTTTNRKEKIDSWENILGNAGMHSSERIQNSWHSTQAMFQMMELGYIEKLNEDKEQTLKKIVNESNYYMATVLMSNKKYNEAEELLSILDKENAVFRYGLKYAACLQYLNKNTEARKVVDVLKQKNKKHFDVSASKQNIQCHEAGVIEAILLSCENKHDKALELLLYIEENIKHLPQLYIMIGNEYAMSQNWIEAENHFSKAIQLQSQNINALQGLMYALEKQNKNVDQVKERLNLLTKNVSQNFKNTLNGINNLDFNPNQTIDFRKYQLIIRLFLEQFHKGVKMIN